jgi:hypothetical protein
LQCDRAVAGIKQAVECGAAGVHPASHLHLGDFVLQHDLLHLPGHGFLDGDGAGLFKGALFLQEVFERGTDVLVVLLDPVTSFLLCLASARSSAGVFCVFLINP